MGVSEDFSDGKKINFNPLTGEVDLEPERTEDLRKLRYTMQDTAARVLGHDHRVNVCHMLAGYGKDGVEVREHNKKALLSGLAVCGNAWACPVCSQKIAIHRSDEIRKAIDWARGQGLVVSLVTLTVRHHKRQSAAELVELVTGAWRSITGHYSYTKKEGKRTGPGIKDNYGIVGYIRSLEVTHGLENGWHPHLHIIFFSRERFDSKFKKSIHDLWVGHCVRKGYRASTLKSGITVVDGLDENGERKIGEYINKFGDDGELLERRDGGGQVTWDIADETARGNVKRAKGGNRKPFQILQDAATCADSARLFHEFVQAFAGKSQLQWSPRLKDRVGVNDEDDQTLAEKQGESDLMFCIPLVIWTHWRRMFRVRARKPVFNYAFDIGYLPNFNILNVSGVGSLTLLRVETESFNRKMSAYEKYRKYYGAGRDRSVMLTLAETGGLPAVCRYMSGDYQGGDFATLMEQIELKTSQTLHTL